MAILKYILILINNHQSTTKKNPIKYSNNKNDPTTIFLNELSYIININ